MTAPNSNSLNERAWPRALRETHHAIDSWPARIASAFFGVVFAAIGALATEAPTDLRVLLAALGAAGGPLLVGLVLASTSLFSAPYRQRDEARRLLLDISRSKASPTPRWFESYDEAAADMVQEIITRVSRTSLTTVRCAFVTGESGWPMLQNLILRASRLTHNRLDVELALLDPAAIDDGDLRDRVERTIRNVKTFMAKSGNALAARQFHVSLYGYGHRPSWHAVLIEHDLLYFTPSNPEDLGLAGQQHGTEKILGNTPQGRGRIRHIASWLDHIAEEKPLAASRHQVLGSQSFD